MQLKLASAASLTRRPLAPALLLRSTQWRCELPKPDTVTARTTGRIRKLECLLQADSVEKVGFSARLNSDTTTPEEPTHHIEWFFGPSVTFAALLL
ncbi:hypothetical protein, partial [Pseudomonas veronii]|uniref:hypothetical protein n=1 Tax=Pseudomonas veronii TaxID=76761 RepID=UPI001B802893